MYYPNFKNFNIFSKRKKKGQDSEIEMDDKCIASSYFSTIYSMRFKYYCGIAVWTWIAQQT